MGETSDREQELAQHVQIRKKTLLGLLAPGDQKTTRNWGSSSAQTFEDKAAELAQDDPEVAGALLAFHAAVNELWLFAINLKRPEKLAYFWSKQNRGWLDTRREDVEAEVLFALRHQILRFEPRGVPLLSFAKRGIFSHLNEWRGQQGPLQFSVHAARVIKVEQYRESAPLLGGTTGVSKARSGTKLTETQKRMFTCESFEDALLDYWEDEEDNETVEDA